MGAHGGPEALVLAHDVLQALGRVPAVVAVRPGQVPLEGVEQVVGGPGQDDDVVHVQQRHDHDGGVADSCGPARSAVRVRKEATTATLCTGRPRRAPAGGQRDLK